MSDTTRRSALKLMTAGVVAASLAPLKAFAQKIWWKTTPDMDAMTAIRTRRSVRSYTEEEVTDEQVKELLGAAMSAPSAGNEQPWEFILIRDKETLGKVGKINNFAAYARSAPLAILVCGNLDYDKYHGYWFEDVSAATQNLLLAAHAMGLGAVWTGCYPKEDRVKAYRELVGAPENVVPLSLVVVGHPKKTPDPVDRFQEGRIHKERWQG